MKRKLTRAERGRITYDVANSAYSIVITTAIFPIVYESITPTEIYVATGGLRQQPCEPARSGARAGPRHDRPALYR